MQKLAVIPELAFVQVALARLGDAGIRATTTDATDPADLELGGTTKIIWVADDTDLDRACRIVEKVLGTATVSSCPECGYDLSGHSGRVRCPECDHAVHASAHSAPCPACGNLVPEHFEACWSCGSRTSTRSALVADATSPESARRRKHAALGARAVVGFLLFAPPVCLLMAVGVPPPYAALAALAIAALAFRFLHKRLAS